MQRTGQSFRSAWQSTPGLWIMYCWMKRSILGDTYGYRDHRTDGMDAEVAKILPETELYARTGIQKQIFNTIYQLMAV